MFTSRSKDVEEEMVWIPGIPSWSHKWDLCLPHCLCAYRFQDVGAHKPQCTCGGQRTISGKSLMFTAAKTISADPQAPRDPPVSASSSAVAVLGLQNYNNQIGFYIDSGFLNSGNTWLNTISDPSLSSLTSTCSSTLSFCLHLFILYCYSRSSL